MFEFCFDCALKSKSIDSCRVVIKLKNDDIFKKFFMIIKMIMIVVVFNMHEKTIPSNHSIWYLLYDLFGRISFSNIKIWVVANGT